MTFWREASEIIRPVVPHFGGACWYTLDPASLLITSHYNDYMPVLPPEFLAHEYYEDDVKLLAETIGVDKVLFGSDWPHGEGLADPMSFTADIPQFPEFSAEDTRKVMRDNALDLLGDPARSAPRVRAAVSS